jgi:AcrR family transcriptional regulator
VRARKRDAITQAARLVFGRQGYSRTSIDAIAAEAGVSTRTIYNHFPGKEHLFASVLTASATQVATSVVEGAAVAFAEPLDVERALVGLGRLLAAQQTAFPEHFAMVRQIDAERAHFPDSVFEAWQDAGPRRVRAEVVARLGGLAQQGFLTLDEVERAALHFVVLTTAEVLERFRRHGAPPDEKETAEMVSTGVAAFLRGYGN